MSYYISISIFKDIVEENDVLNKALSFCNKIIKNANKEIHDNLTYFPSYDDLMFDDSITPFRLKKADILFLDNIFTHKFIYWRKYKLLGVVHDLNDDEMQQFVFQNSCDQDTDFTEWYSLHQSDNPCRCVFKQIVTDTVFNKNTEDIRQYWIDKYDDADIDPTDEYYKKVYVYSRIEEELSVTDYLYGNISDDIFTFRMGAHMSDHEKSELRQTAVDVFKNMSKEFKQKGLL